MVVTAGANLIGTLVGITDPKSVDATGARLHVQSRGCPARTDSQPRAVGRKQFYRRCEGGTPGGLRDLKRDPVAPVCRDGPHVQRISKINGALVYCSIG